MVTSVAGIAAFEALQRVGSAAGLAVRPDWQLGLLLGAGGLAGSYCGARLQKHVPDRWIRRVLALLILGLALSYLASPLAAQCLADNPGGNGLNANRPSDSDVPAAKFSPIARLNRELPDWLCFNAGYRARFEGYTAGNFRDGNSDYYLLTRLRVGALFTPAAWFKAYAELQDATAFWKQPPLAPPYQTTWDLRRAYIDLGDLERGRISVRAGRQDLAFGHLRLVGTAYWRNASRGYDAVRVVANWKRVRVNVWAASPVVCLVNGLCHHQQGDNFHGIYTTLKDIIPGSDLEPYALWRLSPGFKTEAGITARLDEKTAGLHWAGVNARWDYDAEITGQTGSIGPDPLRAWAGSAIAGYTLPFPRFKTRIFAKYDYASGDRNPRDGIHGTFDQLYPNIHDHHGLADQVAWQNLKSIRCGVRVSLRRNFIVAAAYNDWWLASANDAFYGASGAAMARDPAGLSGTHIGREYDAQASYRPDRRLELGIGVGYIRSGDFLVRTIHARSYTYPYAMLNYNDF